MQISITSECVADAAVDVLALALDAPRVAQQSCTLRKVIEHEMECRGESWQNVIACNVPPDILDAECNGCEYYVWLGPTEPYYSDLDMAIYTENTIYTNIRHPEEGETYIQSIWRNPQSSE